MTQKNKGKKMLYKYRADNTFTEMIFTTGKVHLSVASALNDPFECNLKEIGSEWINNEVEKMKLGAISGFVMSVSVAIKNKNFAFGMHYKKLAKVLEILGSKETVNEKYKYFRKFIFENAGINTSNADRFFENINSQLESVGIFSLAESPSNQLMWAHYAGEHRGICIGFDDEEPNTKLSDPNYCLKVFYSDELPEMAKDGFKSEFQIGLNKDGLLETKSYQLSFTDSTLQKIISTKPASWSYEQEWRYVEPAGGAYEWPSKIKEIVFGVKCPKNRREYYIELANRNVPHEVSLYEMVKVNGSNEVFKVPYALPKTTPDFVLEKRDYLDVDGNRVLVLSAQQFAFAVEELIQQGDFNEALLQVEKAEKDVEGLHPHLISLKAMALGHKGEHKKALEEFTKLSQLCPDDPIALYQLSCALDGCGQTQEAVDVLKRANMLPHEDASIPYNLGVMTIKLNGDRNEALPYLIMARSLKHPKASTLIDEIQKISLSSTAVNP